MFNRKRLTILEEMERLAAEQGNQPPTTNSQRFLSPFDGIFGLTQEPEEEQIPYPVYLPEEPVLPSQTPTNPSQYHIFTDGSCLNNGKKGAKASYAVVVLGTTETGQPIAEIANTLHVNDQHTENQSRIQFCLLDSRCYTDLHKQQLLLMQ